MKENNNILKILVVLEVLLVLVTMGYYFFPSYFSVSGIYIIGFTSIGSMVLGGIGFSGVNNLQEKNGKLLQRASIIFIILGLAIFMLPWIHIVSVIGNLHDL